MTRFSKILILGVVAIIVVVVAVVFVIDRKDIEAEKTILETQEKKKEALIEAQSQPRDIVVYEDQPENDLNIQEVINLIPSRPISDSELQDWKSYTSETLGISFKYPPQYLVVEVKEIGTHTIGAHVALTVFEDTPYNRHHAKILNPDFDYVIPEDQKNPDLEVGWTQRISFLKSIESGVTQDIVEWYKENKFGKNGNPHVYAPAQFIGTDSVIYLQESLFTLEGVVFEKEGYLYQFGVQYYNSPESPRDDFYKIISTVKFQ